MQRTSVSLAGAVAALVSVSACGGPTKPSRTTEAIVPTTPYATGTISLIRAIPDPGTDLTVDPAGDGKPPNIAAAFSVTVDRALQGATLEVRILDGNDQSCGSATSVKQDVPAGQATPFGIGSIAVSCTPPATLEKLSAELVVADASQRTEYVTAVFPAHYSLRAAGDTVTLSGLVVEAGAGPVATATVEVVDGPYAQKTAVTDAAGHYTLAGLKPGTITVRSAKAGYDNSYMKVTLSGTAVTQNFTMTKPASGPPPAGSGTITFVASEPAPGGEAVMTEDPSGFVYLRDLKMQFAVRYSEALPDAKLQVDLFDGAGQRCAYSFTDHAIAANQNTVLSVPTIWVWEFPTCAGFPVGTVSAKVTLLTLREPLVNGLLQRTEYAVQTFPLRYTIQRYPAPPPNAPASLPVISDLVWKVELPVGGDPPIPGDPVSIACTAREADGAAMTVSITVTWDGVAPRLFTQTFPAGASSSPVGARLGIGQSAPSSHAKVDCVATNSRGESARKSTDIGRPPS